MSRNLPRNRELAFSVTRKDLKIDTFSAGGPGGQHVNHSNTAVRITHIPSGAAGEARDNRSQHVNMKAALRRMAATGTFRAWVNRQLLGNPLPPEEQVKRDMAPENLLIMGREGGRWRIID
jgi:RF-1 domain